MLVEKIRPNGVSIARPPLKAVPPGLVWQLLQLPIAASSPPVLMSSGLNVPACGRSIGAIADVQVSPP